MRKHLLLTKLHGSCFPKWNEGKVLFQGLPDNQSLKHTKVFHFLKTPQQICTEINGILAFIIPSNHKLNKLSLN
jgi:hypothetical protein